MNSKHCFVLFLLSIPFLTNAQDYWMLSATNLETTPSSEVCLDINVHPSAPILTFQFSLGWDADVLDYKSATTVDLPSDPLYGPNFVDDGKLLISWFGSSQFSVTERATLFTVCFDAIGELDDVSPLNFTNDPTPIEIIDPNFESIPLIDIPGSVTLVGIPTGGEKLFADAFVADPSCLNNEYGEIDMFVEGGVSPLSVVWSGPNGYSSDGFTITDLEPGWYHTTVMDFVGFSLMDSFEVKNHVPTIGDAVVKDVKCNGDQNGSINITMTGGVPPFSFDWSNGSNFEDLSSLAPGVYEVTVVDSNMCAAIYAYTIAEPSPITLAINSLSCPGLGLDNGGGVFTASGGGGDFEFFWSNGAQNSSGILSDVAAGNYTASVTDQNNCLFVEEDFTLEVGIESMETSYTSCGGQAIALEIDAPNAVDYLWSPASLLSCTTCAAPIATVTNDTMIDVTITNPGGCTQSASLELLTAEDCVWPGDANDDGVADHEDVLWIGLAANAIGPARDAISTNWVGVGAMAWGTQTPISDVDYKFIDCNGDGVIDGNDVDVIMLNYGEEHGYMGESEDRGIGAPLLVNLPTEVEDEETYEFDLYLGDVDNAIAGALGMAFELAYDNALVDIDNISLELDGWFGNAASNIFEINRKTPGSIDIGWVRSDGQSMSGVGKIGTLTIEFSQVNSDTPFNLSILNPILINESEGNLAVDGGTVTTTIKEAIIDAVDTPVVHTDVVFPNPAKDFIQLQTDRQLEQIVLFDTAGRLLKTFMPSTKRLEITGLNSGLYFLELHGDDGVSKHKVVIEK